MIEAYEEASRALDRRLSSRFSSQFSMSGMSGGQSVSGGAASLNDSFQSSGLLYETTLDSPSPNKNIGLSPWMQALHFETSAQSGKNVEEAFVKLLREVRKRREDVVPPAPLAKRGFIRSFCNIL